jgi:hypothetical protein
MENNGIEVVKESENCISLNLKDCKEFNEFKENLKKYKEFLYQQAAENLIKLSNDLTNIDSQIKANSLHNIQRSVLAEFDQDMNEFPFLFLCNNFSRHVQTHGNNKEHSKILMFYLLSNSFHAMANIVEFYMDKVSNDSTIKILMEFIGKSYEEFNDIYHTHFHREDEPKESPK